MISLLSNSRKHDIVFHANGKIDVSAHIVHALGLQPGDVIDIVCHNGEWLIYQKLRAGNYAGRHEGALLPTNRRHKGTLRTWSKAITSAILELSGAQPPLRCPCGESLVIDGTKYLTIIYRCSL